MANFTNGYNSMHDLVWDALGVNSSSAHGVNISATTADAVTTEMSISNNSDFSNKLNTSTPSTQSNPWEALSQAYQVRWQCDITLLCLLAQNMK